MYTIVPLVQFSGIVCPPFVAFVIYVIGFIAHSLVALYASPGIPSLPCAFLFVRFLSSRPMSCSAYSWLIHVAVSGSSCRILVSSAFVSDSSYTFCYLYFFFSHSMSWMCDIFGFSWSFFMLKHSAVHTPPIFSLFRPFLGIPRRQSSWSRCVWR